MTKKVKICCGTGCLSSKSDLVKKKFDDLADEEIEVKVTGCHGNCSMGPVVIVDEQFFSRVKERDVQHILDNNEEKIEKLTYTDPHTGEKIKNYPNIPFYSRQERIVLKNCGVIDPENINDYIQIGGYQGLEKTLTVDPQEVIEEIKESGLRGRGGAGFPTGLKWQFARNAPGNQKYVIINADEGDPGAFMDRSLLEADPHSVLEGFIIGGYAIGASVGVIYVRAEYPLAVTRFEKAIKDSKERGFLGQNILGSGFDFEVRVYKGAGAFVCGEETALIASVEGNRGIPVAKPPFPASSGLWGKPTNINNVKTWSAVSWIMHHGASAFNSIGSETSKGTAIFSLTGKVYNSGLIEVPMGTTLREIIYEIGGGILENKEFKAVQTGGPSGGCIPAEHLDTPVDFENMAKLGSIMGSGGMVVIDHDTCIVDFSKYFLAFTQHESCGKCTPCREGTVMALDILERITRGDGTMQDLEELEIISNVIRDTSLCGLGQTAPNPVISTLQYFREEYIEHIAEKKCRAGVCPGLFQLKINPETCTKCGACLRACPTDALIGDKEVGFSIRTHLCIGCKVCVASCNFGSIEVFYE